MLVVKDADSLQLVDHIGTVLGLVDQRVPLETGKWDNKFLNKSKIFFKLKNQKVIKKLIRKIL